MTIRESTSYLHVSNKSIVFFYEIIQLHIQERKSSFHVFEALSLTSEENQENSNEICTFNQYFKYNPLKRYGRWDGGPLCAYQIKAWQDK